MQLVFIKQSICCSAVVIAAGVRYIFFIPKLCRMNQNYPSRKQVVTYLMAATLSSTKLTWPGQSMRLSRYDFPAVLSSTMDTGHDFTDRPRCCSSTRVSVYRTSFVGSNGFTLENGEGDIAHVSGGKKSSTGEKRASIWGYFFVLSVLGLRYHSFFTTHPWSQIGARRGGR